jgi:hypothetical protein
MDNDKIKTSSTSNRYLKKYVLMHFSSIKIHILFTSLANGNVWHFQSSLFNDMQIWHSNKISIKRVTVIKKSQKYETQEKDI